MLTVINHKNCELSKNFCLLLFNVKCAYIYAKLSIQLSIYILLSKAKK